MINELDSIKQILNSKINSNNYSQEELDKLTEIFNIVLRVNNNISDLKLLDDLTINYLIEKNMISEEEKSFIESNRYYESVYNKPLDENTIIKIKEIIQRIITRIMNINKSVENKEINTLLNIVDNNFIGITEEQLDMLFNEIKNSNLSLEDKRDIFIYISVNSLENVNKEVEEIVEEKEEIENIGISLEEAIEVFSKYGYDFNSLDNYYKNYLLQKGVYKKIDDIFNVLKENNIDLNNNFDINLLDRYQYSICEILVKSDSTCVSEIIKSCIENDLVIDGKIPFYQIVEDPGRFIKEKREYRRRFNKGGDGTGSNREVGKYESYLANVKHFKEMCERIYGNEINFLKRIYEKCNGSLLTYPHKRVLEIERILKTYGLTEKDFFESATTVFMTMRHADVLDTAIELGLIDYFKKNQSRLSISTIGDLPDLLYAASTDKANSFKSGSKKNFIGIAEPTITLRQSMLKEKCKSIAMPKGIYGVALSDKVFQMYEMFDKTLESSDFDINTALRMADSEDINTIKVLEEKFKKDDLTYEINGTIISRLKVLRIYSALNDLIKTLDQNKSEYLVLLYSLSKNSYFTPEQIISFSHAYKDAKEEMMRGKSI